MRGSRGRHRKHRGGCGGRLERGTVIGSSFYFQHWRRNLEDRYVLHMLLILQVSQLILLSFWFFLAANNPFPTKIVDPAVAQHKDTFYIIGGDDGSSSLNTIYRFEVSDESWRLMPNRLKFERKWATAMMVKSSLFPTCDWCFSPKYMIHCYWIVFIKVNLHVKKVNLFIHALM